MPTVSSISQIERAEVLGAPLTVGTFDALRKAIVTAAQSGASGYVCIANVHMVVTSQKDTDLRESMQRAMYVTTDGMPLVWYFRRRGYSLTRVAGPDLTAAICEESARTNLPLFFYGGSASTIARLSQKLRTTYPGINIAGMESPPILPARPTHDPEAVARINASGAKIVFVGLGCPKQELWMSNNSPSCNATFIGVGAAFDFLAGSVKRAPHWMQYAGLEWLYRLISEPRRLARRYLTTNLAFIYGVGREFFQMRRR